MADHTISIPGESVARRERQHVAVSQYTGSQKVPFKFSCTPGSRLANNTCEAQK